MNEFLELFHGNRIYDVLIHWPRKVAKFTDVSRRVQSGGTIYLNIGFLDSLLATEGVHNGLCLYTEAYIHNVDNWNVIPYTVAILADKCWTNHSDNVTSMDWNEIG